jgi:histidinol-phosphate phosphatase family protein
VGEGAVTEAVIVAGGKGTRLKHISGAIPKPMVPVGGKPVLEHQFELLRRSGVTEVHVLTGYLGHVIEGHFGTGERFGVTIRYLRETAPLGTAGCLATLAHRFKEPFVLLYGDLMLDMAIGDFLAFHLERKAAATLAVHPNDHPHDSDLVVLAEDSRIMRFLPKEREPGWYANCVSAAAYILSPAVFHYIPVDRASDFVKDVFPVMLGAGEALYGYKTSEYIKDMGTPERYRQVNRDYESGKIARMSRAHLRPAVFIDRDGTLVEEVHLLHRPEELRLFPFSAGAVKRINASGCLAFLATNQPVVARGLCGIEQLNEIHRKLETLLGEQGSYLDDIYFCPHHPDRGYPDENPLFKIECECRKPNTGMIQRAAREYPIECAASWMIGDRTADVQTGIAAGLMTIMVRTGSGGKDGRFDVRPDFTFDTLDDATAFIFEDRPRILAEIAPMVREVKFDPGRAPLVIAVGGQSRSGKSTLVSLLAQALRQAGISVRVLSLDNWLVDARHRTEGMSVRERFRYPDIESDIDRLLAGERVVVKHYDACSRTVGGGLNCCLDGASCLIVDGVPALDIAGLRKVASIRIFAETPEETRRNRFFAFYRWKDIPEPDIEALYLRRLQDEVPIIEASRSHAHRVVRS